MTWAEGNKLSKSPEQKLRKWPKRTHTSFDGYENDLLKNLNKDESSKVLCQSLDTTARCQDANRTLLLLSLIEELCVFYESDPQRRRALFNTICQGLSKTKFLEPTFSVADLENMRLPFRKAFLEWVNNTKSSLQSLHLSSSLSAKKLPQINIISIPRPLPSPYADDILNTSRYLEEFEELEVIGRGGFGTVCKALKRVDRCIYAVKKINFRYTNYTSYQKILREVELLAKLNHSNVVAYKTAWIENQLLNSGSITPMSSSDKERKISSDTSNICKGTAFQRCCDLSTDKTDDDDIKFVDDSELKETKKMNQKKITDLDYQKEIYSINYNNNNKFLTNSSLMIHDYINLSPTIAKRLLEIPHMNNSYTPLSIKEITNTLDISNNESSSYEMEEYELNNHNEDFENFACSPTSRHRHGSGATCKSHSESEMDDILTLQRRENSSNDIIQLPIARCSSFDDNWKVSKIAHIDEFPLLSWNVRATLYVQMELCAESLRDWLDQRDNTPLMPEQNIFDKVCEKEIMALFRQILKGVEYIHSQDFIHRDLKPQNILFDCNHSKIKIGDFGLAICYSDIQGNYSPLLGTNECSFGVGTTPYAAPEQLKGQFYDTKADMYSLGIILLELLHPFNTKMERAECLKKLNEGIISKEVKEKWPSQVSFIERLISKESKLRPSAKEILNSNLYLSKTQIIENLQKEIIELRRQLCEKNKEILQLKRNSAKL